MTTLEEVAARQTQLGREIEKLSNSYYADSPDRKTINYLKERVVKLQKAWSDFEDNDNYIRDNFAWNLDHDYFTKDYYNKVKKVHDTVVPEILNLIKIVEERQSGKETKDGNQVPVGSTATAGTAQDEIRKMIKNEERLLTTLDKILTNIIANTDTQSHQYYAIKKEIIKKYWGDIEEINKSIWESTVDKAACDYNEQRFFDVQEKYQTVLVKFADEQGAIRNIEETRAMQEFTPMMRLPKIELPKFDGSYLKWQQFHDLFSQMVHNRPLSNAQKMFYLKANLVGEAERLVRHIPVSNDNYTSAWETLKKRYANKRLLVTALMDKLISQPSITNETSSAIRNLHDTTRECVLGLETLGLSIHSQWDPILLHILLKKLDKGSHTLYEQSLKAPRELQTLSSFLEFLETRFQSLEALGQGKSREAVKSKKVSVHTTTKDKRLTCYYCDKEHAIYYCGKFLRLSTAERLAAAKKYNLCLNCLKQGHDADKCTLKGCFKCHQRHNTLLHSPQSTLNNLRDDKVPSSTSHIGSARLNEGRSYVFLGTAVASVLNGQGQPIRCRILLDSGSQVSLISERLSKQLRLPNIQDGLAISGIGKSKLKTSDRVNITINSRISKFSSNLEAYVIKEITCNQPQQYVKIESWNIPENISLADPDFNKPEKIDILIGADLYGEIMLNGQIKLCDDLPILQNTTLGWMVLGKLSSAHYSNPFCGITNAELDKRMKEFWQIEECAPEPQLSQVDKRCEEFFVSTVNRNEHGRYVVNMPIFTDPSLLGNSQNMAQKRLISLEKKLMKKPELYGQYNEFLHEYERLGHMKEIKFDDVPPVHYFLPHHFVLKPDSTTTKLRVVFDASAKTTTNLSLNDLMVAGPRIQDDLFDVILRFRMYRYVFMADIAQMYRQILMDEEDRNLQLIMWRDRPTDPLKYYQLCTVTYGTKAAPFLATRCLKQLAQDEALRYPLGARAVDDFYVDDIITGHDSLRELRNIQEDLDKLLRTGGFKLRKWCANHPLLLERIPREDVELQIDLNKSSDAHVKTLGLSWEPKRDCFKFNTAWSERPSITKRTVLADLSQLFDPLGLVNPVIVLGKIFMQQLWALEFDWDDELPDDLKMKWIAYKDELSRLNQLKVGRYVINGPMAQNVELHAFADASEKAYGTVVYVRSTDPTGEISVKLLCAKSRVAPRKVTTLPRLELCAAKLATQLVQRVERTMPNKFKNVWYWSDSTIVLSWINGDAATLKTFNANRVQRIQDASSPSQWRYVSTRLNPADMVSRGSHVQQLINSEMWFWGPSFLRTPESEWPNPNFEHTRLPSEERAVKIVLNVGAAYDVPSDIVKRINHGNSFSKLQRIVAYVLRAVKKFKKEIRREDVSFLKVEELDEALMIIVKAVQAESFHGEIQALKREGKVKSSSRLATLTPFIDEMGLLRVGGRLEAAEISYSAKHPLLLPGDHTMSKLLMNQLHTQHLHAGPQALIAFSRQRYWILQGRTLARSVVNSCVQCARAKPHLMKQLMGNLPASRVLPGRAFLTTGVDFCGPIWTHYKLRGKRPHKSYVAVFCCFTTKAVHLEVVSDLSSDAFMGALKRFVARRGLCRDIYCDNATNFVGTNNQLAEIYDTINGKEAKEKITHECSQRRIQFHFNPPRSPHFGGLWEAAVKSFKQLLYKTVAPASLTYEELTTVVSEIEAIMNSRPLTPMSSDPNDLTALTPGHFLIGEPLTSVPDKETTAKMSSLTRWKLVSSLTQEFWKRWTLEYLSEMQKRIKWTEEYPNIKKGTMVIVKIENLPPLKWPLGRVIDVFPGPDGKNRVVEIRTATGVYKRTIHNICPLPINTEENSDLQEEIFDQQKGNDDQHRQSKRSNEESAGHSSKRKKRSTTNALGVLLLTCLLLPCSSLAASTDRYVEIQPLVNQPGIYYERLGQSRITSHDWKWYIYYDMTSYWNMLTTVQKGVKKLEMLASMIKNQPYFDAIVKQQKHTIQQIDDVNDLLVSHHGLKVRARAKRGLINGVGMVARKLFGVLDEEYATEVRETIQKVQLREDHLLQLLKNQTSVIEATELIMKKSEEDRIKQARAIQNVFEENMERFKNMNEDLRQQQIGQTFLMLSTFVSLIISEYQQIQATLLDTITDVHHGKINTRIISAEKIRSQITQITEHLPPTLSIPSKEVAELYRLMSVKCDISRNYTIFVVKMPLTTNIDFELYKLIPLPTMVGDHFISIRPSTELMMTNLERDSFYPLSQLEFIHCTVLKPEYYVCQQHHPVYHRDAAKLQCEAEIINRQKISDKCALTVDAPSKIWIQLTHDNRWLFSLDQEYVYNVVCGTYAFQKTLHGTGLLKLQKGCLFKDDDIRITAYSAYDSQVNSTFLPNFNLTNEIQLPKDFKLTNNAKVNILYGNHTEELTAIQQKLQDIRRDEDLPTGLQIHDIHQYGIAYTALGVAVILGLGLGYLYHRIKTMTWRPPNPIRSQRQHPQRSTKDPFSIELRKFKGAEDVAA